MPTGTISNERYDIRRIDHRSPTDRAMVLAILDEYLAPEGDSANARYPWLYLANPCGVARTYVAVSSQSGAAVGVSSLFPRRVRVGDCERVGAIGGDAYVTPAFRRRGIARALHLNALEDMDDQLAFMFGPPEPNNLQALIQAGAKLTGSVRRYTRPLRSRALHGLLRPLGRLLEPPQSRLRVEPLRESGDSRVDTVWQGVLAETAGAVVPVRDSAFYSWRFAHSSSRRQQGVVILDGYVPLGVAAIEHHLGRTAIVDVTCTARRFHKMIGAILDHARGDDAVEIQMHVPSRRREAALLALGFIPRRTKPFQVQTKPDFADQALVTRPDVWTYTWGDGDVDHILS